MLMLSIFLIWLCMAVPLFFLPGCVCCMEFVTCANCSGGADFSRCWELVVAGVADNTCTNCTNVNGTFTLDTVVPQCNATSLSSPSIEYYHTGLASCFSATSNWVLGVGSTNTTLVIGPSSFRLAIYQIATSSFDCEAENTISKSSNSVACTSWPSTLTVTPIACP